MTPMTPMKRLALLLVLPALLVAAPLARGGDDDESSDPPKAVKALKAIAKSWKAGKVDEIIDRLSTKCSIRLALSGGDVKPGKYRKEQAKALLKKYFAGIETKEFKAEGPARDLSQVFRHRLVRLATDEKEKRRTLISLAKEGDDWVIVEIIEN